MIRLGEWDASSEKEPLPYQNVLIDKVIIHPRYNAHKLFHDIALLILKVKMNLALLINRKLI